MIRKFNHLIFGLILLPLFCPDMLHGQVNEKTPSLSQYFSWINNTNEGSTESQTLINLDFFRWMKDEYGMTLDIYVISAGAIDKARWYGSMKSEAFRRQFPNGFDPLYRKAKSMGTRLGTWGGPDGFGNSPEEEQDRIDMMVTLCRDYEFRLLKFDAVVGQLRDEKQDAFIRMMVECRKYSPDLILLNHRLNLGPEALKHATTSLWGGEETYIDVHMPNWKITAPHHRATAISRDIVPGLKRLTEDHGVCLSSCLDYWEDDLVLQSFNRSLILSPQIYGNPWLLRDEEYPKLARIFNLARQYGEILVDGMVLPEDPYGEKAVSRGDPKTRLLILRNTSWEPSLVKVKVGKKIGLTEDGIYEARLLHPTERIIGTFNPGDEFTIDVEPFRAALILVCPAGNGGVGIAGSDFQIIQDVPDHPLRINILGYPGTKHRITLDNGGIMFSKAVLDGKNADILLAGKAMKIEFSGQPYEGSFHRKIADLVPCDVPEDAEALYEATVFSADNNALEIRSLERSGETMIPEVKLAREAFLNQDLFHERGLWDRYMFDGDLNTAFYVSRRHHSSGLINRGALRLDFGKPIRMDSLIIELGSEYALQPWKTDEAVFLGISRDLSDWTNMSILADKTLKLRLDQDNPIRYVRFRGTPDKVLEVTGYFQGKILDRKRWRGSHLFGHYSRIKAEVAWSATTTLKDIPKGAYLSICLEGEHGVEGAYAAIRVNGIPVGAPDRSPSYPVEPWEYPAVKVSSHYTYYIPLEPDMRGKKIDIFVLGMQGGSKAFKPEVWLTCYPAPFQGKELILYR